MSNFTADQRTLLELMWRVAEEAWSAGWKQGLEFELWRILQSGPEKYGAMEINSQFLSELREASEKSGGWIFYDPIEQEMWVAMSVWLEKLKSRS